MNDNFDKFLRSNKMTPPDSPRNEMAILLSKIEENKSFKDMISFYLRNKLFWSAGIASGLVACLLVITINKGSVLDEKINITAGLYTEDLAPIADNHILE